MIKRLDHVCITVDDFDAALANYKEVLGVEPSHMLTNAERGIRVAMFPTGNSSLELIGPMDAAKGKEKFSIEWGSGVHHVCLEVDDIDKELKALTARGKKLTDPVAKAGPFGKIAYLGKDVLQGALIQYVQK